jgi:choloylglycine hydrolase
MFQSVYVMASGQTWPLTATASPSGTAGPNHLSWTNTYGFVGMGVPTSWATLPTFNDGLNTAGLSVGGLWMAPGTEYPPIQGAANEVSFYDFPSWILGNFATVEEFCAGFGEIAVVGPPALLEGGDPDPSYLPLHYVVTDSTGRSAVVEFIGGKGILYPNATGVLTNWPTYDWHSTNVENYFNLTPYGSATTLLETGNPGGGGLLGLPGDPLSTSRFVKASILTKGVNSLPKDGFGWLPAPGLFPTDPAPKHPLPPYAGPEQTAVTMALQLVQLCMGTPYAMLVVDVENGPATTGTPASDPPTYTCGYGDYTMWSTVRDHTNVKYYFSSVFSGLLTHIDLNQIDFTTAAPYPNSPSVSVLPQQDPAWYVDATADLTA